MQTKETIAYKVLTTRQAEELAAGVFKGAPVDLADGYIHLSTSSQVTETVDRHFAGQAGLVIAAVDLAVLGDSVRWEPSRNGQLFPHVYGALTMAAVVAQMKLARKEDGTVVLPD